MTGTTSSSDFPVTPGAFKTTSSLRDAFVAKIDTVGKQILYSTFLGPSYGSSIAVDAAGDAYIAGMTESPDFPVTQGAYETMWTSYFQTPFGYADSYITKLNATGSALVYSTFLRGTQALGVSDIAGDTAGDAYVISGRYVSKLNLLALRFSIHLERGMETIIP